MNYSKIYSALIDRARDRIHPGPTEKHHVLPRCLGGRQNKANMVKLTPREHYIAHQLLVKMYPDVPGLKYAVYMMSRSRGSKTYEWLKKMHADVSRRRMLGKVVSASARAKISATKKGRTYDSGHRDAMSAGRIGLFWVTNGIESKQVKGDIPFGYRRGRK